MVQTEVQRENQRRYNRSYKGYLKRRRYIEKHRDKIRAGQKRRNRKLRDKILLLLGNKCNNPNCPIPQDKMDTCCLHIDHINNLGYLDRDKHSTGNAYYYHILRAIQNGSKEYQLLCVYCNWLKEMNHIQ